LYSGSDFQSKRFGIRAASLSIILETTELFKGGVSRVLLTLVGKSTEVLSGLTETGGGGTKE
jgi:hypothetical protein